MAWRSLFFAQGSEAIPLLELQDASGAKALVDYLADIDALDYDGDLSAELRNGDGDLVIAFERFVVSSRASLSYIGVEYREKENG